MLEPVRTFGSPLMVGLQPMPFAALQSAFDPLFPPGLQWYWKGDVFREITDEAIEVHRRFAEVLPSGQSTMHLYPIDGAAAQVPEDATAFPYRDGGWSGVIVGVDPDPANAAAITRWARDYWEALHPYSAGGAYINFMMEEGEDRIRASYRGNYDRLARIKRQLRPGQPVPDQPEHRPRRQRHPAAAPGLSRPVRAKGTFDRSSRPNPSRYERRFAAPGAASAVRCRAQCRAAAAVRMPSGS